MGRTRNSGLESPRSRSALKQRIPAYWVRQGKSQHLGYRKGATGGFWLARYYDTKLKRRHQVSLGRADDLEPADDRDFLSFDQATAKAGKWFEQIRKATELKPTAKVVAPSAKRVDQAVEDYIEYLYSERKGGEQAEQAARKYIYSHPIAKMRLIDLTYDAVDRFRKAISEAPRMSRAKPRREGNTTKPRKNMDGSDRKMPPKGKLALEEERLTPQELKALQERRRKSTSNRVLTILKAALNREAQKDSSIDDRAWRLVRPFRKADGVRTEFLDVADAMKLVAACPSGLQELVLGALYTGARYGELQTLRVWKVFPKTFSIRIEDSKSDKARVIPLSQEAAEFFEDQIKGKKKTDLVFVRPDGSPWGKSHTFRPFRAACDAAGVTPIAFHELRHTFASQLIMRGAGLPAVAEALGHESLRMVEQHYGHLQESWLQKQIDKCSPSFQEKPSLPTSAEKPKEMTRVIRVSYGPGGEMTRTVSYIPASSERDRSGPGTSGEQDPS